LGAKILQNINPFFLEKYASKLPFLSRYKNLSNKIPKLAQALSAPDLKTFFQAASVYAQAPLLANLLPDLQGIGASINPIQADIDPQRQVSYMGLVDVCTYLEGDILTKVDRATMQQALEGREPLLDHKLVEFGLALPDHYKIRGQETKYLLRKILYKHVPPALLERPKQGFAIPIDAWLRGQLAPQLRAMANDSLFLQKYGFAPSALEQLINQFLKNSGRVNPSLIWFLFRLYAH
jgi:asparagine synthase (glutamine-hydrolysing)